MNQLQVCTINTCVVAKIWEHLNVVHNHALSTQLNRTLSDLLSDLNSRPRLAYSLAQ